MEVLELLKLVNSELEKNKSLTSIAKVLGVNESTIRKNLNKLGYKRIGNQFVLSSENTSKTTKKIEEISKITSKDESISEPIINLNSNLDIDKLNLLLSNLDNLLKLVPSNMTSNSEYRSGLNDVKSFRIDTGLYAEVKNRSAKNNINIAEILNRALEDYLKNYL
ncbi:ribbon-helix-helix domain-containing protein [Clostridium algidicarnis]|uniref:ribbon-helix-helix domain-containing protein n=1 Tax=Clostridium algidicarnis TaxID=37659 RepID=UPI001C0C45F0|nr:ribbon-helix-helix domain-containing protein [Clostridium algidicarnis]MBU3209049.1 ribbon-helix-helix domain-containing protein [Clostridium algidicarnis]MBU3228771.1 ribbon-helix-helix domain-containing protein [Clostridium algidicarnis]MBU3252315.1 ribbon-helix-helix domain-containing protein [Clostridium algidicarnis]